MVGVVCHLHFTVVDRVDHFRFRSWISLIPTKCFTPALCSFHSNLPVTSLFFLIPLVVLKLSFYVKFDVPYRVTVMAPTDPCFSHQRSRGSWGDMWSSCSSFPSLGETDGLTCTPFLPFGDRQRRNCVVDGVVVRRAMGECKGSWPTRYLGDPWTRVVSRNRSRWPCNFLIVTHKWHVRHGTPWVRVPNYLGRTVLLELHLCY